MGMTDAWAGLAHQHGAKSVMSLVIDDATLYRETRRQAQHIFPLIRQHLRGGARTALDYGCGAGRFSSDLADLVSGKTYAFDTSPEMIATGKWTDRRVMTVTGDPDRLLDPERLHWADRPDFGLIFSFAVLCLPMVQPHKTIAGFASVLSPGGTIILIDHMTPKAGDESRWISVRPQSFYDDAFAQVGMKTEKIGDVMQLNDRLTILMAAKD